MFESSPLGNETEPRNEEELIDMSQPLEEFILYTG
jgi:hypothetical protein